MECDVKSKNTRLRLENFNSRTHVECDGYHIGNRAEHIHFNSRTHVECDVSSSPKMSGNCKFQLTHSRGVRPRIECGEILVGHFNSRTHVECDRIYIPKKLYDKHFNSRTHVECDLCGMHANAGRIKFQLTHSRGVRPAGTEVWGMTIDFNSRTHVECDCCRGWCANTAHYFNSRTHVECDLIAFSFFRLYAGFQLTHSRGVRHIEGKSCRG